MSINERIALLEDLLEIDVGTLKGDELLTEIAEWTSMAALALIVLMDETYNKKLTGEQIRKFITVRDILNIME